MELIQSVISCGEFTFKISAKSFYQVNPVQTEKLYNLAVKEANLTGDETVFDLYCGIGTIGIFASKFAKKVYGIEIVEDAIENAKENSRINGITNIEFMAGDTKELFHELIYDQKIIPDCIFIDPPRKGLDDATIVNLLNVSPQKIIYISCNPATFVRDVKKLEEKYEVKSITPFDLFPWTSHVECCSVLELREN